MKRRVNTKEIVLFELNLLLIEDYNEAILCFEQAIKHKSSRKAVLKSLYEIIRIKIEQRNFYEAHHTLQRVGLLELEEKTFSRLKLYTEGVISSLFY